MEKSGNRNKYPHGYLRSRCALNQPESHGSAIRLWNDYEITASGTKVSVRLNGKLVCQGDVGAKGKSGYIGMQYHSGKVQFRNIRVQRSAGS